MTGATSEELGNAMVVSDTWLTARMAHFRI
jgi:hypothetical protein